MTSLCLAILSSAMVSIMMRYGEGRCSGRMGQLMFNYAACSVLGFWFAAGSGTPAGGTGLTFAVGAGIVGGVLFLASLMMLQRSVSRNGVVMSSTFMKLGVLVPTLMAVLVFRERPGVSQILGFLLALTAILMLHLEGSTGDAVGDKPLLLLLLLVGGSTDAMTNVYDKLGAAQYKDLFLLVIFLTAFCITLVLVLRGREKLNRWDVLCGLGVGIPNYFSSWFTMAALRTVPAVVVFPVYSVATIVVITLAGKFLFRETLSRRKLAAMAVIFAALILLNR